MDKYTDEQLKVRGFELDLQAKQLNAQIQELNKEYMAILQELQMRVSAKKVVTDNPKNDKVSKSD